MTTTPKRAEISLFFKPLGEVLRVQVSTTGHCNDQTVMNRALQRAVRSGASAWAQWSEAREEWLIFSCSLTSWDVVATTLTREAAEMWMIHCAK